jgi:copper chaperone CopZ
MRSLFTAIIHLREPAEPGLSSRIEPILHIIHGVDEIHIEPKESLVTLRFDGAQTGLADIVRAIEDAGPTVISVAQRKAS